MSDIEENTGHRWRPSPGSVYPLLSWLLDSGYTKELADTEAGVRRYELTEQGRKLLQEHEERRAQDKSARLFGSHLDEWDEPLPKEARELAESWYKMRRASGALRRKLRKEYSETLVSDAKKLMDEFTEKISKLAEVDKA
jgi:DNA-binding PadR family transcriptional regulator